MSWKQQTRSDAIRNVVAARLVAALLLFSVFLPAAAFAETAYDLLWLKQFGEETVDEAAMALAQDPSGNWLVAGNRWDPTGQLKFFVAKFTAAGEQLWLKQVDRAQGESRGIAVDANGDSYVTGFTTGSLEEGKANSGRPDFFLAKFRADGEELWVKQVGTEDEEVATGVAVDNTGQVLVGGYIWRVLDPWTMDMDDDCFLAAFSAATGEQFWFKKFGGSGGDSCNDLALDGNGNVFLAGSTYNGLEPGKPDKVTPDVFVAKLTAASGDLLWVKQFGTEEGAFYASVAAGPGSSLFVTGHTLGSMDGTANAGETDVFLTRLSADTGDAVWIKQFGSSVHDECHDVAVDPSGAPFIAGAYIFPPPQEHRNGFLVKFDAATGERAWEKQLSSSVTNIITAVAIDAEGKVLLTGATNGVLAEGKTEPGINDSFLAKLGAPAVVISPVELMTAIIREFDRGVAAGTIVGTGHGKSARAKQKALRDMLVVARKLIAYRKTGKACWELSDIYRKMDGMSHPHDFVRGPGVAPLAARIAALRATLGCPQRRFEQQARR